MKDGIGLNLSGGINLERKIYLNKLPLEKARRKFNQALQDLGLDQPIKGEVILTKDSLHRVTAQAVFARISSPHYLSAAMDGIAVRAKDTYLASESSPLKLKKGKDFYFINTGQAISFDFDAVIKIEEVNPVEQGIKRVESENHLSEDSTEGEGEIEEIIIFSPATPGQHIRSIGEDIIANQLLIPINHLIRSIDIGALLAGGVEKILVRKKPKVGIIPIGDELIQVGEPLIPGKVIEYNSSILKNFIKEWGGEAKVYNVVKDVYENLKQVLLNATQENDIIVVIAGSSAGSRDYTAATIEKIGKLLVHGISIMPGKPTVLGVVKQVPVVGLPGYSVSAVISAEQFLKPFLFQRLGLSLPQPTKVQARMAQQIVSHLGDEEFLRVQLGEIEGKIFAFPLPRGAGVITSLVEADGIVHIPLLKEGLAYQEKVMVEIYGDKNLDNIKNTIIITGSHDLIIDILKNELKENYSPYRILSFNVGSMGGLFALKQHRTHIATAHLLDPYSGEYNLPYLDKMLSDREFTVINLVFREQGMMVPKGNPKHIKDLNDLVREDIRLVNRQKGSGTRILLDYLLKKQNIDPLKVKGYFQEVFTHLVVASAVAEGIADVGVGIFSAAQAFNLDFIPLTKERYDIIVSKEYFSHPRIQSLLHLVRTEKFKSKVLSLGGYDLSKSGMIIR